MNPTTLSILLCRGIGLCFTVASFTGLLPYLIFDPLFHPIRLGPQVDRWAGFRLLWSTQFGYQVDSMVLNLVVGVLLLLFSRRIGRWLALRLPAA